MSADKRQIYDIYLSHLNGEELTTDEYRRLIAFYTSNRNITDYTEPIEEVRGVGRPPKYYSPQAMQSAIDEYFSAHQPKVRTDIDGCNLYTEKGKPIITLNPPTISGLALFLGFVNRQSMYDYEKVPEFSDTIKRARSRCEEFVESGGMAGEIPAPMAIFALKNHGWSDKQELEHSGKDGEPIKHELISWKEKIKDKLTNDNG